MKTSGSKSLAKKAPRTKSLPAAAPPVANTRATDRLSLKDRLSRISFPEACKLLGPEGKKLIQQSGNLWEINVDEDVYLGDDLFRLRIPEDGLDGPPIVTIARMALSPQRLHWNCTHCSTACEHVGAAFALILEEKIALGLAAPTAQRAQLESLDENALVERAIADRAERAKAERMRIQGFSAKTPWSDYLVTSRLSGKTYRVALRGLARGESYCSCPDFRTNTLGTCKHVLKVASRVKQRFSARQLQKPFEQTGLALALRYDGDVTLRLLTPAELRDDVATVVRPLRDRAIENLSDLMKRLTRLQQLGHDVAVYPDADEFIQLRLFQQRMSSKMAEIRRDPASHSLRSTLLKTPLLPYQLDGIAFAAGAGRAILADDMGLGKTIQGVGVAEILAREAGIRKVLIICPASLKSQWRGEIHRFCDRDVQLVGGPAADRQRQYDRDCFFTVCNYEQVLRDILAIERSSWDLIILDEGQRIKNWEAKTSGVIKSLKSRFALVLSGTPLENRLDDLYSIVQFVDDRRLGPGFRFFNKHRIVDEKGKVLGYKNLADLRATLAGVLLRRTRDSVKLELPPRTTEIIRIPPTDEQLQLHATNMQVVASITHKKFLSEMDLLRLQKALLMCRMAADSTMS